MSAGSPRRSRSQTRSMSGCTTVTPQRVTDPTILDSVAGFINEVATYNVPLETKDQIQWASFEQLDCDAVLENLNGDKIIPSSLILVLGYTSGIQVWAIPANGEAVELLSWRHGSVRVLRVLPAPYKVGHGSLSDVYAAKRPLMALCDATTPGPHHCSLSFLSLKTGDQVKVIKFKNPILDVLANRRSVVVTFSERIAIFDAFTLEDRLTVTTCYLSPGIYPNPVALGARWMAYAENRLIPNKRSNGGNEGEGVQSYTATVLHAAKTLGKGLRELGETVANSLTGNPSFKPGSPGSTQIVGNNTSDALQKGVVTILDIEKHTIKDKATQNEMMIAHFIAHTEAIVCLAFDPSGLLLLTADKRGHDFYLFRIQPHPGGPSLAAVHHLYVLHRGDTTARVQDMCFSPDSRWVAVSTLRGTTHVFPITPYGGNVGVRTHATPHVVNRMSRFHRSAGLPVEGRSNSPVSLFDAPVNSNLPYNNPRLPPYPHPTVVHPLAQIRQPLFIQTAGNVQQRLHSGRPRLNSSSEDNIQVALRVCCCFAPARAWFDNVTQTHDTSITKEQTKPVESLFTMSCHGTLLQYDLDPHHISSVPKEKVCDETPIELTVQAKAQWILQRQMHLNDVPLPLSPQNLNLLPRDISLYKSSKPSHMDDRWLSQVEIITHAGPHRRLWMGPQFTFKTYTTTNGPATCLSEVQAVDVGRSKPVNMPVSTTYPILIESGSVSSCEQSPKFLDTYQRLADVGGGTGETQLKEDLADAMMESPGVRDTGGRCVIVLMKPHTTGVAKVVNPLGTVVTIRSDDDGEREVTEDAVIHENCDEALFRPVVAPKPRLLIKNNAIINKPLLNTQISISETVKTKPIEHVKDSKDIVERTRTLIKIAGTKNADILNQEDTDKPRIQTKNNKVESKLQGKIDLDNSKIDTISKPQKLVKTAKTLRNIEIGEQATEIVEKLPKVIATAKLKIAEAVPNVTEAPKKLTTQKVTVTSKNIESTQKNVERTPKPTIINMEESLKMIETIPKIVDPMPTKKSRTKLKDATKTDLTIEEFSNKSEETNLKINKDLPLLNKNNEEPIPIFKSLITTPDLMDSIDTLEFPFTMNKLRNKDNKIEEMEVLDFSLAKSDDAVKEDKFEDARDIFESFATLKLKENNTIKTNPPSKYANLEVDEIVTSEEEKTTNKKVRKPKTKLGVRLSKEKDILDKDKDVVIQKKTWSNIVSKPKQDVSFELPKDEKPIIELPESDEVDKLPKKAYSTVTKQHLFEIDPLEDVYGLDILLPEKICTKTNKVDDLNVLKVETKLSDDEKQENVSSQTESDDSSKIVAMDTEEDGCQPENIKNTTQGGEQAADCMYRDGEDLSSTSSFSSASRASPSPSYSAENLLHFPGDSSSSL